MAQTVDREEAKENEDLYDTDDSLASTQDPLVAASLASTQGLPVYTIKYFYILHI